MKHFFTTAILGLLLVLNSAAQQPQRRLHHIVQSPAPSSSELQEKNLQLELTMSRGDKSARYRMTFNGGQVTTDLMDKLSDQTTNSDPKTISFTASYVPFEDGGGGEVSIFIGRNITYRSKVAGQGNNPDREVVQQRSIGLTTKVALRPDKPVVIFDDEDEKITLKLTEL